MTHSLKTYVRLTVLCLALTRAGSAAAQGSSGAVHHRNDCRLAAQVLETGHPAPKMSWARDVIITCGEDAIPALVASMHALRTSDDTAAANAMRRAARYYADPAIFAEALAAANDRQATVTARAIGFVVAAMQLHDNVDIELAEIFTSSARPVCQLLFSGSSLRALSRPLPTSASAQVSSAANNVLADPHASVPVANAASCAVLRWRLR